jgi:hypothetical protein
MQHLQLWVALSNESAMLYVILMEAAQTEGVKLHRYLRLRSSNGNGREGSDCATKRMACNNDSIGRVKRQLALNDTQNILRNRVVGF